MAIFTSSRHRSDWNKDDPACGGGPLASAATDRSSFSSFWFSCAFALSSTSGSGLVPLLVLQDLLSPVLVPRLGVMLQRDHFVPDLYRMLCRLYTRFRHDVGESKDSLAMVAVVQQEGPAVLVLRWLQAVELSLSVHRNCNCCSAVVVAAGPIHSQQKRQRPVR